MEDLESIQLRNEYTYDKAHMVETLRTSLEPDFKEEVAVYMHKLKEYYSETEFTYMTKEGEKVWVTKQDRFREINNDLDMEELAWDCIVHCVVKPTTTITEVVGKFYKKFKHETDRQNLESAAEFVGVLAQTQFIDIIPPRNTDEGVIMVQSNVRLDKSMQTYLHNLRFTLPSIVPLRKVESNSEFGYRSIKGSLILGGRHHDKQVCYDHINRMNKIELSINTRLFKVSKPIFKDKIETDVKRAKRLDAFIQCNTESAGIYAKLVKVGNKFHLAHQYCSRGRTYAHGYHVQSQGDNFRKGILELANKEVVRLT